MIRLNQADRIIYPDSNRMTVLGPQGLLVDADDDAGSRKLMCARNGR